MSAAPLRRFGVRIANIQRRTGIPYDSALRDHALSYMLAGIFAVDPLAQHVVFKGGTALRKCYFADYRYSEDLDFSSRDLFTWTTAEMADLILGSTGPSGVSRGVEHAAGERGPHSP